MIKPIYLILFLWVMFFLISCDNSVQQPPQQTTESQQKSATVSAEDKLDNVLLNLVKAREKGGEKSVFTYAESIDLTLEKGQIPVTIIGISQEKLASIQEKLAANGGTSLTTLDNNLYALIPVQAIKPLAADDAVWTMSLSRQVMYPLDQASGGDTQPDGDKSSPKEENPRQTNQNQTEKTQP